MSSNHLMVIFVLLLLVVTTLCHAPIFNKDLAGIHVWRQSQTQLNIVNFYRNDFNILNPQHNAFNINAGNTILRYEFPLMQWLIAINHKLFGSSILITRISLFVFSLLTLLGFFKLLFVLFQNRWTAFAGTWAFAFCPLFYYYSINPLPDNFALLGAVWFLYFFFKFLKDKRLIELIVSAGFISISILSKLPFVLIGTLATFYVLTHFQKEKWSTIRSIILAYSIALVPPAIWYINVIPTWAGNGVLTGITKNPITWQEAFDILAYHFDYTFPKVLLNEASLLCLILSILFFFVNGLWKKRMVWLWLGMFLALIAYFLFELNMISKVHDYYLMPFLPLLYVVVAYGIHQIGKFGKIGLSAVVLIALIAPYLTVKTIQPYWNIEKSGFNNDFFIYRDALRKAAPLDARCIMLNDHSNYIIPYQVDKRGYVFTGDQLPADWVKDMILRFDATYMYSDSRIVDENPAIINYFEKLLGEYGTVRVFKLKSKTDLEGL